MNNRAVRLKKHKVSYKTLNKYDFLLIMKFKLIANGEIGNMGSVPKLAEEECEPTPDQKESKKASVEFVLENQLQLRNAPPRTVLVWYFIIFDAKNEFC